MRWGIVNSADLGDDWTPAAHLSPLRIPASCKGETGWLHMRLAGEGFTSVIPVYSVTMDEANATDFRSLSTARRHAARARRAGLIVPSLPGENE